jgi:voltage-gated potassium channel
MLARSISPDTRQRLEKSLESLVILAAIVTVPLTVLQLRGDESVALTSLDWLVWGVFTVEYLLMVAISHNPAAYTRRNWLNVLVILLSFPLLPALMAFSRLVRLTRLFRLLRLVAVSGRGLGALRLVLARRGLLYVSGVAGIMIIAAAGILVTLEPDTVDHSFGTALWWAAVTTTTVGYGDVAPVTHLGRVIAVLLMFVGIGLIATLAASIAAFFVDEGDDDEFGDVAARLERIEATLDEIRGQLLKERHG